MMYHIYFIYIYILYIYKNNVHDILFQSHRHSATEDVLADLNNIPYMAGKSNTFAAFDMIVSILVLISY